MAEFNCRVFGVVLNDENKILLVKRNPGYMADDPNYHKGYTPDNPNYTHIGWELIGGGLEHGEDPKDGVIREHMEEIGIVVEPVKIYQARTGVRNEKPLLNIGYICKYVSGDVTLTTEHTDFMWVTHEELKAVDFGPNKNIDVALFLDSVS